MSSTLYKWYLLQLKFTYLLQIYNTLVDKYWYKWMRSGQNVSLEHVGWTRTHSSWNVKGQYVIKQTKINSSWYEAKVDKQELTFVCITLFVKVCGMDAMSYLSSYLGVDSIFPPRLRETLSPNTRWTQCDAALSELIKYSTL